MRISRIYEPAQLAGNKTLLLPGEVSHYLTHVLRLRIGNKLHLFNARDGEFVGEISNINKNDVAVDLLTRVRKSEIPSLKIHLALGLSLGDKMDYAIQKSSELGVAQITPVYSQHSEVKLKANRVENKLRHWRKIAISACEQCGRLDIPEISAPCSIPQWFEMGSADLDLMLEPTGTDKLPDAINTKSINLLVGPEGGFADQEVNWARDHGFVIVAIGSRVLRAETAPVAALAILQHLYGDM